MCKQDKWSNRLREGERERHTQKEHFDIESSLQLHIFKSQYHTVKSRITEFGSEKKLQM